MIFECPNCRKRITVGFDCQDYVHDCSEAIDTPKSITEEDIVVIGNWEDYSGSGTKSPQEVMRQGIHNELQGTRIGLEGEDKEAITRRGVRASTRRQRNKLTYINLKKEGLD